MEDIRLVVDLLLALGAAVICGAVAVRIGLPVIIGYIAAGLVIGPNTPGFVADRHQVELLANVGVAFLMFALGVEFSMADLQRVRRVALQTGGIQIPLTILLGAAVALFVGWNWKSAVILGGAFAISSTIVAVKVLMGRGEMQSPHGTIAIGIGVVQDLSLVVMLALIPALSSEGDIWVTLAKSVAIATVALAAVIVIGPRLVPKLLERANESGSRELFLLTVVVIALGTAAAAHEAGISFALGAFLAGMVVSGSEFDAQVSAQIGPLRDLFATLFFVAVGMLLEPSVVLDHLGTIVLFSLTLVIGKTVITGGALLASGVDHWTTTRAAIVLGQMGEFSFVLAGVGIANHLISDDQYGIILSVALASILIMPLSLSLATPLTNIALRLPFVARREQGWVAPGPAEPTESGHAVICGYGRIGSEIARSLRRHNIPFMVIELNPVIVRELRSRGDAAIFGDAAEEHLLHRVGIEHAATLAITVPDVYATRAIIRMARDANPGISIIARAPSANLVERVAREGANEVVQPEFEAAMEFTRQMLDLHGIEPAATIGEVTDRRAAVYGAPASEAV